MILWEHYHLPRSVDEALASLSAYDGKAQLVGGGTDLILELQQRRKPPVAALVDVTRIPEMNRIAAHDGFIYVGAAVTHTNIVASELLTKCATCLVESCGVIGGPQVRNVATLGGNVAHALPAGDGTISLAALDAEAEVATMDDGRQTAGANRQSPVVRRQWKPVLSLFVGPGKSAVDNHRELIVRFRFRAADVANGEATAFKRVMRPQGVALPILNMAVWLKMSGDIVDEIRIALGPAGAIPLLATKAETYLTGIPLVDDVIPQAADLIVGETHLRTSPHRATAEYRAELIPVLFERAIKLAHHRAMTGDVVPEGLGLA